METQIFTEYPVTVTTTETQIEVESPDTTVAFDPTRAVDGYIKSPVHRCEVYKRSNRFLIAGRDWVPELLDNDGLGLRHQLYQCSSIQEWNFVYLSNSPDRYEWKAQGRLGSYPKRCIEKMGTEAGAPVPIKCNEYDIL
ncbi:hypothetical protein EV356DRAFT_504695 [Viridothelium virens]|uniref:Uncharacterized protein n=1 Tax=Viridothelium virens TaxID=1048519 RepID=A0A6A6H5Z8_VIRVR|nr:hypothetical protein EV356DRAFT_504695 [Viridothelium virens]